MSTGRETGEAAAARLPGHPGSVIAGAARWRGAKKAAIRWPNRALACSMFEDWKRAWREAVANFQHELHAEEEGTTPHEDALRRELATARGALAKLDSEIAAARRNAATERESEQVCRRREAMAAQIGDDETVRVAVEYAGRHAERASVLEQKVAVLEAERSLLQRDLEAMEQVIASRPAEPQRSERYTLLDDDEETERQRREFQRLQRERNADERLEELKRKLRSS